MKKTEKFIIGIPLSLVAAIFAAGIIQGYGSVVMPQTIGVFIDGYGMSLQRAGFFVTVELTFMALAVFLLASVMAKLPRKTLALIGAFLAISGNIVTFWTDTSIVIGISRAIVGLGEGCVAAAMWTIIAGTAEPERVSGMMMLALGLFTTMALTVQPQIVAGFSHPAYFLFWAICCFVLSPMLRCFPQSSTKQSSHQTENVPFELKSFIAMMLCSLCFFLSIMFMWAYSERFGLDIGLTAEQVGYVLGASTLASLVGSLIASWLGKRVGRTLPIVIAGSVLVVAYLAICHATGPYMYIAGLLAFGLGYFFCFPYIMGVAATLDPSGRIATAIGGVPAIASAVGPVIGAWFISWFSMKALGSLSAVLAALCCIIIIPTAVRLDRRLEPAPVS